jgi:hypothetical protein
MTFFPQTLGGAIVVWSGGAVDLATSVFESNYVNGTVGEGIVNLGGGVHCASSACLPICTSCEHAHEDAPLASPTQVAQSPSPWPTQDVPKPSSPFPSADAASGLSASSAPVLVAVLCTVSSVTLVLLGGILVWRRRRHANSRVAEQTPQQDVGSYELLDCTTASRSDSEVDSIEPEQRAERCTQLLSWSIRKCALYCGV